MVNKIRSDASLFGNNRSKNSDIHEWAKHVVVRYNEIHGNDLTVAQIRNIMFCAVDVFATLISKKDLNIYGLGKFYFSSKRIPFDERNSRKYLIGRKNQKASKIIAMLRFKESHALKKKIRTMKRAKLLIKERIDKNVKEDQDCIDFMNCVEKNNEKISD